MENQIDFEYFKPFGHLGRAAWLKTLIETLGLLKPGSTSFGFERPYNAGTETFGPIRRTLTSGIFKWQGFWRGARDHYLVRGPLWAVYTSSCVENQVDPGEAVRDLPPEIRYWVTGSVHELDVSEKGVADELPKLVDVLCERLGDPSTWETQVLHGVRELGFLSERASYREIYKDLLTDNPQHDLLGALLLATDCRLPYLQLKPGLSVADRTGKLVEHLESQGICIVNRLNESGIWRWPSGV